MVGLPVDRLQQLLTTDEGEHRTVRNHPGQKAHHKRKNDCITNWLPLTHMFLVKHRIVGYFRITTTPPV